MSEPQLTAHKITQPFQLMAAWFVMLILLETLFVTAAIKIENPLWIPEMFSIASVSVPIVVFISVFLMQTVFRPYLQEGDHYFQWLKDQQEYRRVSVAQFRAQPVQTGTEVVVGELQQVASAVKQLQEVQVKTTDLLSTKLDARSNLDLQELRRLNEKLSVQLGEEASHLSGLRKASSFPVEILDLEGSGRIAELLRKSGFNATIYNDFEKKSKRSKADHAAIWVGKYLPVDLVKDVVSTARGLWPHLEYMHLSGNEDAPDHVNYELFLGGSTKSATGMFNCQPWTEDDFGNLKTISSEKALHDMIRSKMG